MLPDDPTLDLEASLALDVRVEGFEVIETGDNAVEVSLATLPRVPEVHLLRPSPLRLPD